MQYGSFPIAGDVNGDGHVDIVVTNNFSDGRVFILLGNGNGSFTAAGNYPVNGRSPLLAAAADFNGDGRTDIVTANINSGNLSVLLSTCLTPTPRHDFDGDGKADVAVFRPASGTWYALASTNNSLRVQNWGINSDMPVPADYDGDGKTDVAVYRQSSGTWFILRSSDSAFAAQQFGLMTDMPVAANYPAP